MAAVRRDLPDVFEELQRELSFKIVEDRFCLFLRPGNTRASGYVARLLFYSIQGGEALDHF